MTIQDWQDKLFKSDPKMWKRFQTEVVNDIDARYKKAAESRLRYLNETPFEKLGFDGRRHKILLDQNYRCAKCQNEKWFDVPLTLEIDHINGDHQDNRKENLVALCPNCHSITPTWRGRNKRSNTGKVSDDTLIKALESEPSMRQALIKCGMSPRGGNYKRLARLKDKFSGSVT